MSPTLPWILRLLLLLLSGSSSSLARTDKPDVSALNVMFESLNKPSQLSEWKSSGGDPCGESWKGIKCSGSSITEIDLSGLGLTGSMGYQLSSLKSVTYFDMSKNNLQGQIPYQLPPNLKYLNLAGNAFTGGVPYSISQMTDLKTLILARNQLNGQVTDMFGKLPKLSQMDLSVNRFSGNLPQSFGSLSSMKILHLENNQFSGTIAILAKLPLQELYVQNNQFTGWIPNKFKNLKELETGGNPWSSGPAPPGTSDEKEAKISVGSGKKSGLSGVAIAGIVIGVLMVVIVVIVAAVKHRSSPSSQYVEGKSQHIDNQINQKRSFTPLVSQKFKGESTSIDMKALQTTTIDSDQLTTFSKNQFANKISANKSPEPLSVTEYSFVELQAATGSFSASRLLGEGSIGRVYKAKYADGKTLAVKKLDLDPESVPKDFKEVISNITRLRHSFISELVGYCVEPGHHLLVYQFQTNGSLHDFLHLSDRYSRPLTWDTRIRIALGTARAIEYLHEACLPPVLHKNIKSASILLDADLCPHLSDCGLSAFYQHTSENLGPGYNPPECTKPSAYSVKSDLYSFGVVMLELLTGRKAYDSSKPRSEQILVRWATTQLHDFDALTQMADPGLHGLYPSKALSRFADLIATCVQPEPEFRPSMSEVVQGLARCMQRPSLNSRTSSASRDSDYHYY